MWEELGALSTEAKSAYESQAISTISVLPVAAHDNDTMT